MAEKIRLNWIELSRSALAKNINSLTKLAEGKLLSVSVKANAYGHGIPEIVGLLKEHPQVSYLTVHSLDEAILCRKSGWEKAILMLGPIASDNVEAVFEYELEPVVMNKPFLSALGKIGDKQRKPVKTHLKLETGTNRQGVDETELPAFIEIYRKHASLKKPYGAYTHFANIEDTTSHEYADFQLKRFNKLIEILAGHKMKPTLRHTASSAATILFRKTHFDMVRPGIAVYGYWPSKETYLSYRLEGGENDLFTPVLSWKTRLTQLKRLMGDSFVGYGCTYRTTSPTHLGILPIGYYDGYDRGLSNLAYVLVKGKRAPVRGRICMNVSMVDVTDIPRVKLEDEVALLGQQKDERITADTLAGWAGTINYEILSRLAGAVSKVVVP